MRCKSDASPSASWERPARVRAALRFEANCSRGSTQNMVILRRQKVYRQNLSLAV